MRPMRLGARASGAERGEAEIGDFAVAALRLTALRQCPQAEKSVAGCAAEQIRSDVYDSVPCSFARDKNCPTNGGHLSNRGENQDAGKGARTESSHL